MAMEMAGAVPCEGRAVFRRPWLHSPLATEAIVVVVSAVDAADRALLPATFRALEVDLGVGPAQLGALNLCQSLAFSLALPLWGTAMSRWAARDLLCAGCCLWALATLLLALSFDFRTHCALRLLNGAALSGVTPVAQAVLSELIPEERRGAAFGRMQACTSLTGMLVTSYAISIQDRRYTLLGAPLRGWQLAYCEVAVCSFALGMLVQRAMRGGGTGQGKGKTSGADIGFVATVRKIFKIPSFVLLVAQGVSGGVPWNAMSFLTLYWQTCGFSGWQVGAISVAQGLGGAAGAVAGGRLGDLAAQHSPNVGRVLVALVSVLAGLPLFLIAVLGLPRDPSGFAAAAAVLLLFSFAASWCPPAANRPICAELVNSPAERAQVVALWVMIEGVSASFFGAPLVGWLSERFGYRLSKDTHMAADATSAASLASALAGVAAVSWSVCALVWVRMLWTLPADRQRARQEQQRDAI